MRHTASQSSYGFHFLGTLQALLKVFPFLFGLFVFCDVAIAGTLAKVNTIVIANSLAYVSNPTHITGSSNDAKLHLMGCRF
ncbi:MAG: hypothetical protein L7F78_22430 [Syntrophales bacterium LBB04]|nr:hypothetical protein [Syntrophales bacterium LBB04]